MSGNIRPTCMFLWQTMIHKWYVLRAGMRTGAPLWRLVIHDWTKFMPSEAPHYGRRQYGAADDNLGFAQAWNHHHKRHKHHWEWWIPVTSHRLSPVKAGEPLPMPEWAVREMVADWLGASKAYHGFFPETLQEWDWYHREKSSLRLHEETARLLEKVLDDYFRRPLPR
jgi:hypothetical protein